MASSPVPAFTIAHALLRTAAKQPRADAYLAKVDGRWQATSWRTFAEQVRTAARALIQVGLTSGETVAILGFNRPEWVILDHAAMMAGGVVAGIYTTSSRDEVEYIVGHCEARVVLVENAAQLAKLDRRRERLPALQTVVLMRGASSDPGRGATGAGAGAGADADADADVITWDELLALAATVPESALDARLAALQPDDLATLIYTSGTTGPPKGVMLSHANLAFTAQLACDVGGHAPADRSISYLPLSHVAEQVTTVHMPALAGTTVYFAESIETLAIDLASVRPTVFFGVPRVWEKLHAVVGAKLGELTGAKARLVHWARGVCSRVNHHRDRGERLSPALAGQYALATRLVIGKLKAALGLDQARMLVCGAAPIGTDILEFFASLDLPVREVYGQSETTGPTAFNLPGHTRIGSVGAPLPGLEVKLADDGEIMVRGQGVGLGYYKDPEATAEAFRNGWLASGDLGAFDSAGYLSIVGRKKDILITSGGKNIAPRNIEASLQECPLVADAVVIGDRRKYLTALITLDEVATRAHLGAHAEGLGLAALAAAPGVLAVIQRRLDEVNASVARVEQVKKFTVLPAPFGIATGELTPTMKIKRSVVASRYAGAIDAMYGEDR